MTPERFIELIKDGTADKVIAAVKELFKAKPEQTYAVVRQTPTGPVQQQVSLAAMLSELTDTLKMDIEIRRYELALQQQLMQSNDALRLELKKNRKMVLEMKQEEDED